MMKNAWFNKKLVETVVNKARNTQYKHKDLQSSNVAISSWRIVPLKSTDAIFNTGKMYNFMKTVVCQHKLVKYIY